MVQLVKIGPCKGHGSIGRSYTRQDRTGDSNFKSILEGGQQGSICWRSINTTRLDITDLGMVSIGSTCFEWGKGVGNHKKIGEVQKGWSGIGTVLHKNTIMGITAAAVFCWIWL